MTVPIAPAKKTPWLLIVVGVLAVFCVCAIVIGAAILFFLAPIQGNVVTEEPPVVATVQVDPTPTIVTFEETPGSVDEPAVEAAPAGTAVDIGSDMTLTVLDVTRPADDLVANGNSFNTTPPEGEEFLRVDVEVTCNSDAGSTCTFYPTVMKAVLSDGSTRDLQTFLEGVDDWDTTVELEAGATQQGFLLFLVPKSETDVLVSYNDIYADQPVYFQLP